MTVQGGVLFACVVEGFFQGIGFVSAVLLCAVAIKIMGVFK